MKKLLPNKKHIFISIVSVAFLSVLISSCTKKEDFDFDKMAQNEYETEWAVPILNKKYQLSDFVLDTMNFIVTDPNDQFLTVVYNTGDLWSVTADQLISLPDQSIVKSENVPAPLAVPAGTWWESSYSSQIDLNFNSFLIDSIFLKGGSFITSINTNINHSAQVIVTVPELKNSNGTPLSFTLSMIYTGGIEMASGSNTTNISGYKLALQSGNRITVNYTVRVLGDSYPFVNPNYNIQINTQLNDLKYKHMIGYFGQLTQNLSDTSSIRLFSQHYENSMFLKEFRAHLFMKNSFGIPLRFTVNNYTIYTGGAVRDVITPGYSVDGPYPTMSQFGQIISKHDTAFLNPNMLEISPKYQAFNATGTLNPDNNPLIKNFVTDESKFSVDARLELPMEGKISYFKYRDTLEFHFENIDAIDVTNFRLYVENAFPIDGWMQVYFADTAYNVVDSLILNPQDRLFSAATVGPPPNYYTISNGVTSRNFIVSHEKIEKISNTKWIIVDGKLSSKPDNQFIRIYGSQYVSIILGTRVKIRTNY